MTCTTKRSDDDKRRGLRARGTRPWQIADGQRAALVRKVVHREALEQHLIAVTTDKYTHAARVERAVVYPHQAGASERT